MDLDNESSLSTVQTIFGAAASLLGLILVGFGTWALAGAVYAAWRLFRDPDSIAYFARYFLETTQISAYLQSGGEGLAHYLSWVAVVLLLLVLGKLGTWSVGAGAQLIRSRRR